MPTESETNMQFDVLISGMGLTGLMTAYEALKLNKKVLLLELRDGSHTRVQRIGLIPEFKNYLLQIYREISDATLQDDCFTSELKATITVGIKDLEGFFQRRIQHHPNVKIVTNAQLTAIDMERARATYQQGDVQQEVSFKYLIGADGTHRHAATILNNTYPNAYTFSPLDIAINRNNYNQHFSVYCTLTSIDGGAFAIPEKHSFIRVFRDRYVGVALDVMSHAKHKEESVKANVTGELPQQILTEENQEQRRALLLQFVADFLNELFLEAKCKPVKVDWRQTNNVAKQKFMFSLFTTNVKQASRSVCTYGDTTAIMLGDALIDPIYQIGSGANIGFLQVQKFQLVLANKMSRHRFSDFIQKAHQGMLSEYLALSINKVDYAKQSEEVTYAIQRGLRPK